MIGAGAAEGRRQDRASLAHKGLLARTGCRKAGLAHRVRDTRVAARMVREAVAGEEVAWWENLPA